MDTVQRWHDRSVVAAYPGCGGHPNLDHDHAIADATNRLRGPLPREHSSHVLEPDPSTRWLAAMMRADKPPAADANSDDAVNVE